MAFGQRVGEEGAGRAERHHEREVEEELERGGGPIRFVGVATGHPLNAVRNTR